jgi:ubiquinone/menaquinone biosynthesis C-methylase UbiE
MPHRFSAEGDFVSRLEGPERRKAIPAGSVIKNMHPSGKEKVVDLGAGIGYFSIPLSSVVKEVLAVDMEPKMLEILRGRVRERGIPNIVPMRADMLRLPLPDGSADRVLAAFVYHEVESQKKLIGEAARILRPKGRLTIIDFQKKETPMGPPVEERKPPEHVKRTAAKAFQLAQDIEEDVYYQLEFEKK